MARNELGVHIARNKLCNVEFCKTSSQLEQGRETVGSPNNQLCNHGVVVDRHLVTLPHTSLNSHISCRGRGCQIFQRSCSRHEAVVGIFSIDSGLKRPAAQLKLFLCHRQLFSCSSSQLPLHQVGVGDHLSHWVFHLQPGVHLHEVEVELLVHDKLHSAGTNIVHSPGGTDCSLS